jgi:FKBP-type peptidyl-prolyl cis-trans isomerase 2
MKQQVKQGDRVTLHLTGKTEGEEVFATTKGEQPVEITIGEGKVIPGVENGVIGMQVGESRTFSVPPEDAFGLRRGELVTTIKKDDFPESIQPTLGQQLRVRVEGDKLTDVRVTNIEADDVTLDANHPLAGQTLKFEIDLLDIQ